MHNVAIQIESGNEAPESKPHDRVGQHIYFTKIFGVKENVRESIFNGKTLGDVSEKHKPAQQQQMIALQVQHKKLKWEKEQEALELIAVCELRYHFLVKAMPTPCY